MLFAKKYFLLFIALLYISTVYSQENQTAIKISVNPLRSGAADFPNFTYEINESWTSLFSAGLLLMNKKKDYYQEFSLSRFYSTKSNIDTDEIR